MNLSDRVRRVEALPPRQRDVLAHVALGMSNSQIARALGYKNTRTVASLVNQIYAKIGLRHIVSIIEKRELAAQAFREAADQVLQITVTAKDIDQLPLADTTSRQLQSALQRGYKVESISIVLRKR